MKKKYGLYLALCFSVILVGCNRMNPDSYCVVTFDAGQGSYSDTENHRKFITVKYGTMFSFAEEQIDPPTAYLNYYSFSGWKNGDKPAYDFQVRNNVTVVADYTYVEPVTVTFDFNGGNYGGSSESISLSVEKGTTWKDITRPSSLNISAPTKLEEYDNWSFDKDKLDPISNDYVINNDLHAYVYYRPIYLTFTAIKDNSSVSYEKNGAVDTSGITYSSNGSSWSKWDGSEIDLNKNDIIYVKNANNSLSISDENYLNFKMAGKISASGNVESLVNYDDEYGESSKYRFYGLFKNCSSLVTAPSLPAKKATSHCYRKMFENCVNLLWAPELPATSGANGCYQDMFKGCVSLTRAPTELPIKGLFYGSYSGMFSNCISLTKSPNILLTTAHKGDKCLNNMFNGCESLTYIKLANYNEDFNDSFTNWVLGVRARGEIYYPGSDLKTGESAIPFVWNVSPRYVLHSHLYNCSVDSIVANYHSGESVTLKVVADEGYHLPNEITLTAEDYTYNPDLGVVSFIGSNHNSSLLIEAIKNI